MFSQTSIVLPSVHGGITQIRIVPVPTLELALPLSRTSGQSIADGRQQLIYLQIVVLSIFFALC